MFFSRRLSFLLTCAAFIWLLLVVFRIIFYVGFVEIHAQTPMSEIMAGFKLGMQFDMRLTTLLLVVPLLLAMWPEWIKAGKKWYIFLPIICIALAGFWAKKNGYYKGVYRVLYASSGILLAALMVWVSILPGKDYSASVWLKRLMACYFIVIMPVLVLFYFLDLGHYDYLNERVNVTVLRFQSDAEALPFMWESYPILQILAAWALVSAVWVYSIARLWAYFASTPERILTRWHFAIGYSVMLFVVAVGIMGRVSEHPLRWSDVYISQDEGVVALALNPVTFFYQGLKNREDQFDTAATRTLYKKIATYLGVDQPNDETLTLYRKHPVKPEYKRDKPINVVVVMLESLGANRLGLYGNPLNPTPNLDAIAKEGWWYTNFFVPNNGTARTLYSSNFGIPDVSAVKTATRNPLILTQASIFNEFKDYNHYYFLGGSANWANVEAMLKHNIKTLKLYQKGDYKSENVDVWGISDLSLVREANQILATSVKETGKPFVAFVQTAGSHRPYTIPDDNAGFVKSTVADNVLRDASFINVEQLNAIRFLDHNIGEFMRLFKNSAYYGNTVFVFFGDHNDSTHDASFMRPGESKHSLDALHVPMFIYGPGVLETPRKITAATSLVDVFPTMATLAGIEFENRTFGRDMTQPQKHENNYAFTLRGDMTNPKIGVVKNDYYFQMYRNGTGAGLYDLTQLEQQNLESTQPDVYLDMKTMAQGLYEAARYQMYHVKKDNRPTP